MGENLCVICGRRPPVTGHVCDIDLERIDTRLAGLGGQVQRLALALITTGGATGPGERVTVSRTGSPAPARMEALNLVGPGSLNVPDHLAAAAMAGLMHPHVRRWRTVEHLAVGKREVEIVTWHQEITAGQLVHYSNSRDTGPSAVRDSDPDRPVRLGRPDQVGLVPPAAWAHGWVRRWQQVLGHHPRMLRRREPRTRADLPDAAARQRDATAMLGIGDMVPAPDRDLDPLASQHKLRFGPTERGFALNADVAYLRRWLSVAAEQDLDVALFAAELRALAEELGRVLGDNPDQQWLGRCPTTLTDHAAGTTRPCGAALWQDPYASQITCLRCRSTWGPDKAEVLRLAVAIRRVWPVDRRRLYLAEEVDQVNTHPPTCRNCGWGLSVAWQEVTAYTDKERWWKPVAVTCSDGCENTGVW